MNTQKNFLVYKSSAGSGKTYTLVREYIALALQSPGYFRHILAITFTNKAANEMKQRIVQGLIQLSDPVKFSAGPVVKFMLPDLAASTGFPESEVSKRARLALIRILHEYDSFSVRTIDSFVSRIIRTFAHDLHLPVDFEIEMDRDLLLDEAVDMLISKAGVDTELTKVLVDFTESKADDEMSFHIENDIKKTAGFLFSEGNYQYISKLSNVSSARLLEFAKEIKKLRNSFEENIISTAHSASQLIQNSAIDSASFYQGAKGIGGFFMKLSQGEISEPNSYVKTSVDENKWTSGKATPDQVAAIQSISARLTDYYHTCNSLIEKGLQRYKLLGMIGKNIYQVGVLNAMEQEIDAIRKEKKILHISEFNKRITDIILKEPVPFIYERIGEKYFNYLVDEFQDTSELQWKNLLPLVGESLAYDRKNLVVGDGKQAIYRFRNGQVEQFMMLPDLPSNYEKDVFADPARKLKENYHLEILQNNFRSKPEIINFNNAFFKFISQQLTSEYSSIYKDLKQETTPGKTGGLVSVDFLPYDTKTEFEKLTIEKVFKLVTELTETGFCKSDIAILTRSNREGSIIARFLMSEGINVVSAEALLLDASPDVNFVINILRYIQHPQNMVVVAGILNELFLRKQITKPLSGYFPVQKDILLSLDKILIENKIDFNIGVLRGLPLYDLCEEIIRIFKLNEKEYDVYLQFFLDFVNKVSLKQGTHLADLLEAWDDKKDKLSVIVPEGIDAIRIMTIHKSKGLEFPVVIWPMATEKHKTTFEQLWVNLEDDVVPGLPVALLQTGNWMEKAGYTERYQNEKNSSLLDMINLIYVAFTRPAERLYILTREPEKSETINLPDILSQFIKNVPEGWISTGTSFVSGTGDYEVKKEKNHANGTSPVKKMTSIPWQHRIQIARRAPEYWGTSLSKNKQAWGNLIHNTLASIQDINDVHSYVAQQAIANNLMEEEKLLLLKRIESTVNHELLKPYFHKIANHRPESGIITPHGNVYRPDRVVFCDDETVIMEFKTGVQEENHRKQLENYAILLQQMGYSAIKKFLIYIDENITVIQI